VNFANFIICEWFLAQQLSVATSCYWSQFFAISLFSFFLWQFSAQQLPVAILATGCYQL
jgi:hypothetical protein